MPCDGLHHIYDEFRTERFLLLVKLSEIFPKQMPQLFMSTINRVENNYFVAFYTKCSHVGRLKDPNEDALTPIV